MDINVLSDDGDLLCLEAAGRITEEDARGKVDGLRDVLGPGGYGRSVVLSLAEVRFIDSSGLSWLVIRHKRFCQGGGRLVIHSLSPPISQLLTLMRLDQTLHVAEDEAAALELLRCKAV